MASSTAADKPANTPSNEQVQFARSVYIILEFWPALRQAVLEQWGGEYSEEKREFLLSYVCDEYGNGGANTKPDLDDLTELIESYVMEEFDCELEDDSAALVAGHICLAHKGVFIDGKGDELLKELEATLVRIKPKHAPSAVKNDVETLDNDEVDERDMHESTSSSHQTHAHASPQPTQPIIDEDGFKTVQPRRRR